MGKKGLVFHGPSHLETIPSSRLLRIYISVGSLFVLPPFQGCVKSTPSSPRLRVGVSLTDPEPAKEALWFSYSDSFQLNQLRLWEWEAVRVKYQGSRGHSGNSLISADIDNFRPILSYICRNCHVSAKIEIYLAGQTLLLCTCWATIQWKSFEKKCDASMRNCIWTFLPCTSLQIPSSIMETKI